MAEEMTPQLANTEETTQVAMEDVVEIVQKEMVLNIIVCKRISAEEEIVLDNSSEVSELVVPATEQTVLTLRSLISEKIAIDKAKFVLIASSASANTELEQDDKELFKDYHIATGSQIYVDVIPESFGTSIGKYISPVLTALEKKRLSATIFINDPSKATEEKDIAYDIPLEVKLDTSLSSIKVQIAALLKLEGVDSFHIKRSYGAPQLKDESKTLFDLAVMDQNSLYVQLGKGCGVGEHLLQFELDMSPTNVTDLDKIFPAKKKMLPPSDSAPAENVSEKNSDAANFYLGDLVISEKFTILEMKEAVFNNWEGLASSLITNADFCATGSSTPKPESPNHIRLRDMKAGKVSGPLRDDRIVGRCLLGVIDGRRISVQVLQEEEKIGADDLILSVRWASYHDHKALSHAVDLPMSRADTVKSLYTKVLGLFPSLNEAVPLERGDSEKALEGSSKAEESYDLVVPESKVISIAKGYTSGPPLTLKSSLKLTWNDPAILKEGINNCLDRPPLNLRDGSVLVVRGNADYSRAQAAMKARKLANEEMGVRPGSSAGRPGSSAGRPGSAAGGGAAAVRARMKTNNKFFENTEDTLKINGVVHTIIDSMPDRLPTGISDPSQSSASPKSIPVKLENGSEVPPASSDN